MYVVRWKNIIGHYNYLTNEPWYFMNSKRLEYKTKEDAEKGVNFLKNNLPKNLRSSIEIVEI